LKIREKTENKIVAGVGFEPILIFSFWAISLISCFSLFSYSQKKPEILKTKDVISNPKNPILRDGSKKKIVFKEELSIGFVEGDDNYMFGGVVFFNTIFWPV